MTPRVPGLTTAAVRDALKRLDEQRAGGNMPAAVDFATVVEDRQLDLILAAARAWLALQEAEPTEEMVEAAAIAMRKHVSLNVFAAKALARTALTAALGARGAAALSRNPKARQP